MATNPKSRKKAKKVEGQPVKHILLIHANLINSLCLADIIEMYRSNGYKFITLQEALKGNTATPINDSSSTETMSSETEKKEVTEPKS